MIARLLIRCGGRLFRASFAHLVRLNSLGEFKTFFQLKKKKDSIEPAEILKRELEFGKEKSTSISLMLQDSTELHIGSLFFVFVS